MLILLAPNETISSESDYDISKKSVGNQVASCSKHYPLRLSVKNISSLEVTCQLAGNSCFLFSHYRLLPPTRVPEGLFLEGQLKSLLL